MFPQMSRSQSFWGLNNRVLCVYIPHFLFPLICNLVASIYYCEWCCNGSRVLAISSMLISFAFDVFPAVKSMDLMVVPVLTLWGSPTLFTVAILIYILHKSICQYSFLYILSCFYFWFHFFIIVIICPVWDEVILCYSTF